VKKNNKKVERIGKGVQLNYFFLFFFENNSTIKFERMCERRMSNFDGSLKGHGQ
jgi:hypothetical protein